MQFLYTGAKIYQGIQNDSNLTLGGYISSSFVGNDLLNNLFSDISAQTAQQKRIETKGLILKNTLSVPVQDIIFGYRYPPEAIFKLEVAFVQLNNTNLQQIEKIPTAQASPYYATFQEANITDLIDNSVNIGNLAADESIAVWFKRSLTNGFSNSITFSTLDEEIEFWKNLSMPSYDQTQKIQLSIKYSVDQ